MAYFEDDSGGSSYFLDEGSEDYYADSTSVYRNAGMYLPQADSEGEEEELSDPVAAVEDLLPSVKQTELSLLLSGPLKAKDFSSSPMYARLAPDWNAEFQSLYQQRDSVEKFENLAALATDFVHAAEQYAKIIVSERALPQERKTIKSVDIGGVAGGVKYICQGILFKFAIDFEGIYRSTEGAAKAAGHDLNGLMSFLNCNVKLLHVPLLAVIDYRGYRLVAVSMLPISSSSLCYGSCDGARSVYSSYPKVAEAMRHCALKMNIRGHLCGDHDPKLIHGAADIEVHSGRDNRFYILDFARYMPCEPPVSKSETNTSLYRLLRPELVKSNPVPLSPDAFSRMTSPQEDSKSHRADVREAFARLQSVVIPAFARSIRGESKIGNLSSMMHEAGINMRHLGCVSVELVALEDTQAARRCILSHVLSRVVKVHVRELWREKADSTLVASETPFRKILVEFSNMFMGSSQEYADVHRSYWSGYLPAQLEKRFAGITKGLEETTVFDFLMKENKRLTLNNVLLEAFEALGVVLTPGVTRLLKEGQVVNFVGPDILALGTRCKHINIIHYSEAMALIYACNSISDDDQAMRMLTVAEAKLELSLKSSVQSTMFKFRLAQVHFQKYKRLQDPAVRAASQASLLKAHTILDGVLKSSPPNEMELLELCAKVVIAHCHPNHGSTLQDRRALISLQDLLSTVFDALVHYSSIPEGQWSKDIIENILMGGKLVGKLSLNNDGSIQLPSGIKRRQALLQNSITRMMRLQQHPLDKSAQYSLYMSLFRLHWSYYLTFQTYETVPLFQELQLDSYSSISPKLRFEFLTEASRSLNKAAVFDGKALRKAAKTPVIAAEMQTNTWGRIELSILPGLVKVSSLFLDYAEGKMATLGERGTWWRYTLKSATDFPGFVALSNACKAASVDLLNIDSTTFSVLGGQQAALFFNQYTLENLVELRLPKMELTELSACAPLVQCPNLEYLDFGTGDVSDAVVETILSQCPKLARVNLKGCTEVTTGCCLDILARLTHFEVPPTIDMGTLCSADHGKFPVLTHLSVGGAEGINSSHALLLMKAFPVMEELIFSGCHDVSTVDLLTCTAFSASLRRVYTRHGLCLLFGRRNVTISRSNRLTRVTGPSNVLLYQFNMQDAMQQDLSLSCSWSNVPFLGFHAHIGRVGPSLQCSTGTLLFALQDRQMENSSTRLNMAKQMYQVKHGHFSTAQRVDPWTFPGGTTATFNVMGFNKKMALKCSGARCVTLEVLVAYVLAALHKKIL